MRGKPGLKTLSRWAIAKTLISLLTFHWWVIPMVTSEEQSILLHSNVVDTRLDQYFTADRTTRNSLISPDDFRYFMQIEMNDVEPDGSAEFTVDLGVAQSIMTVYVQAWDWERGGENYKLLGASSVYIGDDSTWMAASTQITEPLFSTGF